MSTLTPLPRQAPPLIQIEAMNRTGFGTRGKKYRVRVNAFEVTKKSTASLKTVYQYDVKISPGDTPPRLNRELWTYLANDVKAFGDVAVVYDSRALAFSPKKLPAEMGKWEIDLPETDGGKSKGRHFTMTITLTREIDLSRLASFVGGPATRPREAVAEIADISSATQALNVVVQHHPMLIFPSKGPSFFPPPSNPDQVKILKGLEIWRGYYSSLRPGPGRLFLNVDVTSQPMIQSGNLSTLMEEFGRQVSRGRPGPPPELAAAKINGRLSLELTRFLKGVRITLKAKDADGKYPSRKIKELSKLSAAASIFETDPGVKTNVAAWFKATYNVVLRRPDWPCVRVSKVALWPIELCDVHPGQKFIRKLDPDQTAASLELTTVGPKARVPLLLEGLQKLQPNTNSSIATQWGLSMEPTLMEVEARELPAPRLMYKKTVDPREGVWDSMRETFHTPKRIENWMILVFDNPRFFTVQDAQTAVTGLMGCLTKAGVGIGNPKPPVYHAPLPQFQDITVDIPKWIQAMGAHLVQTTKKPPTAIICFLADKPSPIYGVIKTFGDVSKGVVTQVLQIAKAKKANDRYWHNVVLKMNVKLGGSNSVLDKASLGVMGLKSTIVFGADVTHPAPGSFSPSIAAVVGSMDLNITKYGTSIRLQNSRVEVIADLATMVHGLLLQHIASTKKRPVQLIFFRDGVSEGQFPQVLSKEVHAIRAACLLVDREYKPTITYIVCGKRHHMSFFPKNDADGDRKNFNVRAGMTVDTDITSPFQFDWYTQSHASLLGTGRSAHYTVLVDDAKMTADQLQQIVYNLCYTYARCSRSVSYCTPAYYADRVCDRARYYLRGIDDDNSTIVSGSSTDEDRRRTQLLNEWSNKLQATHINHKDSLYFM